MISTLQKTCVQVELIVPRYIQEAFESVYQRALQSKHYDDEVDRRRKPVDMKEEKSYRMDNAKDQLRAVGPEREDERAEFVQKGNTVEEGPNALQKASDLAKAAAAKMEGELRAVLGTAENIYEKRPPTAPRVRNRSEAYESTLCTHDGRIVQLEREFAARIMEASGSAVFKLEITRLAKEPKAAVASV